ncbi:hypothetical protein CDD82_1335 [Ophiocordyceps australis]|uniref:Urease accessory protein UreF n=1 Tax=Ophiocordyceps australis TaxID=1399860 RepID=A0A2C5ZVJ1_9HYPO|nr:hypothetical protein CDD82_1335 [Ophiocordyceps australis]
MPLSQSVSELESEIEGEIAQLETRLAAAKARLRTASASHGSVSWPSSLSLSPAPSSCSSPTHFLLLLSDSALPLGAFAFSSGLESFLAHNPRGPTFSSFLPLSLSSFAATTLPFVLAAHRRPADLAALDDELDATVVCTVGRRASIAQGRALLSIWERSFRPALCPSAAAAPPRPASSLVSSSSSTLLAEGDAILRAFAALLKNTATRDIPSVSAHLAPLFGAICAFVGLDLGQTAYIFLLSHVKALISAAVRASMFGPYQAQKIVAGEQVQRLIHDLVQREWNTPVHEAGQSVPVMDLWIGRHELLYSRIFNS